ncbi:MAG: class II fructose-bisphosphate aldolase, partial [Chloroflexi bacterium]|nr:class II fructose-bisphosphate aldolase [Chloroflexota bacterium]
LLYVGNGVSARGLRYVAACGRIAAESVAVPIILHLDHGTETEVIQAISLGFTSVMFDGSALAFEENVARTRELCELARRNDVCFEAEIGAVPRARDQKNAPVEELTEPIQAAEFARRTEIDALAIAIGSVHGMQRKRIQLDLARLAAIRRAVPVPLVLHGSSGVTDAHLRAGIQQGLCKINVATQLNQAFTRAIRARLAVKPDQVDPRDYLGWARAKMQARVCERMRLFGCAGKAG